MKSTVRTLDTRAAAPAKKSVAPFYHSKEWRGLMARLIATRGRRCEDPACRTPARTGIRLFGDHIVELSDGGAELDPANVMLRCGSCHTRKTIAQRAARTGTPA